MKPKKGKASSKASNVEKNPLPQKNVEVVEENNEEEVDQAEVKTKLVIKKAGKGKKVVKEPVKEEEDGVEDDETQSIEADDDEADVDEADDDEAADDEEADYDLEADNDGEAHYHEADDDEGGISVDANPSLKSTGLEEPTTPSKVKSGPIPHNISVKKVIHVTKLPKKCKQKHVIEAFEIYGPIDHIHLVTAPTETYANIAFRKVKAARRVVKYDQKLKVIDSLVTIISKETLIKQKEKIRARSVYVRNIKDTTTEAQLKEHFKSCGEIEHINMMKSIAGDAFIAFITFTNKDNVADALKLHNSVLQNSNIKVFENTFKKESKHKKYDDKTIIIKNIQNEQFIEVAKFEAIFSECGEIDNFNIICSKNVLAFLTFKTAEGAVNALKKNGETVNEIKLDLEPHIALKKWTTIHVINIPRGSSDEDLRTHFAKAGKIKKAIVRGAFGVIRFANSDGFCKSFLYNESFFKGRMIFIEPHSIRKAKVLHKNLRKTYKRTGEKVIILQNKKEAKGKLGF